MKKIIGFIICTLLITATCLSIVRSVPIGTIANNNAFAVTTQVEKSTIHRKGTLDPFGKEP